MQFRSDVVGSLLRPAYLIDARAALEEDRAVDEAAAYVPLDRLALSPQCGFASTIEGNLISPERQREKLGVVAETARAVWGPSISGGTR